MDRRYSQLAQLALNHSLQVKPGERVLISTEPASSRFAEVIGQEVLRAGGHPVFRFTAPRVTGIRLAEGGADQVEFVHPSDLALADCDCRITIDAPQGIRLPSCPPEVRARRVRALGELRQRMEGKRWLVLLQPTPYLARRLGVSLRACEELVFRTTLGVDWQELSDRALGIKEVFDRGGEVRIVAADTDLRFSLAGRAGVVCAGACNLPDGETFYAPDHESVRGHITFHDPQFAAGGVIRGMRLKFSHGEVSDASATGGLDRLKAMLATDEGARRVGEFGIGVNPLVRQMTGCILLDEKIAGTIHLALGRAYPEASGTNQSGIHWDLILDLRRGGQIWLDGRLVCDRGVWRTPAGQSTRASAAAR